MFVKRLQEIASIERANRGIRRVLDFIARSFQVDNGE